MVWPIHDNPGTVYDNAKTAGRGRNWRARPKQTEFYSSNRIMRVAPNAITRIQKNCSCVLLAAYFHPCMVICEQGQWAACMVDAAYFYSDLAHAYACGYYISISQKNIISTLKPKCTVALSILPKPTKRISFLPDTHVADCEGYVFYSYDS